jgi:hypothetical protein
MFLGRSEVKTRHRLKSKWIGCGAFIAFALLVGVASASEGGLVLMPDFTGKLPILILLFALLMLP